MVLIGGTPVPADTIARFGASLLDSEGVKANVVSHAFVDSAQTIANLVAAHQAWQAALGGVCGAQIVGNRATILVANEAGHRAAPVAGSEVQEVGVFDFNQAGLPYHYGQAVPAFLESLVLNGGVIDESQAAVQNWVNVLIGPVLGGNYTGMSTAALTGLYRTFRSDRKRRRQLYARSVRNP
jgi:hypothetical protein